jgi:CheY-like chemotaxis protein
MAANPLKTVLYVDDETAIREIVRLSLGLAENLAVYTAESGEHAILLAHDLKPDLVILDVMMPDMDGAETLRRMRTDPELRHIPVVFMTAKAMPEELGRLRNLGAVEVIRKPFDPMNLATEVTGILKRIETPDA